MAALEFALVLPVLITLVLGCVDFGRFAYAYIAVTNGARAGAALGSVNPVTTTTQATWLQNVRAAVIEEMGTVYDSEKTTITIVPKIVETDGFKRLRVEVSQRFETIVSWPALPSQMTLRRAVEMRFIR